MLNIAPPRRLIKWPAVFAKTRKSRTQAWRDIRTDRFPAPVQIGPNSVAWFEDEIDTWLSARPRVSYAPESTAPERNTIEPLQSAVTEKRSLPVGVASKSRKTRAPVERAPEQRRGPSDDGGSDPKPQTSPSLPMPNAPRGNADVIAEHFCAERMRLWPAAGNPTAAAIEKLRAEAAGFLKAGATVSVMIETLTRQMEAAAEKDRTAPITMRTVIGSTAFVAAKEGATAART
jgi:prophage regulatory protein